MPKEVNRRDFIKVTGATAAIAGLGKYIFDWSWPLLLTGSEAQAPLSEEWLPTTCWIGKQDCGILARVVEGRVVKLQGHPDNPQNRGTLCPKGVSQIMAIYDPYRVKAPLLRVNEKGVPGKWKETTWDEALSLMAEGRV